MWRITVQLDETYMKNTAIPMDRVAIQVYHAPTHDISTKPYPTSKKGMENKI